MEKRTPKTAPKTAPKTDPPPPVPEPGGGASEVKKVSKTKMDFDDFIDSVSENYIMFNLVERIMDQTRSVVTRPSIDSVGRESTLSINPEEFPEFISYCQTELDAATTLDSVLKVSNDVDITCSNVKHWLKRAQSIYPGDKRSKDYKSVDVTPEYFNLGYFLYEIGDSVYENVHDVFPEDLITEFKNRAFTLNQLSSSILKFVKKVTSLNIVSHNELRNLQNLFDNIDQIRDSNYYGAVKVLYEKHKPLFLKSLSYMGENSESAYVNFLFSFIVETSQGFGVPELDIVALSQAFANVAPNKPALIFDEWNYSYLEKRPKYSACLIQCNEFNLHNLDTIRGAREEVDRQEIERKLQIIAEKEKKAHNQFLRDLQVLLMYDFINGYDPNSGLKNIGRQCLMFKAWNEVKNYYLNAFGPEDQHTAFGIFYSYFNIDLTVVDNPPQVSMFETRDFIVFLQQVIADRDENIRLLNMDVDALNPQNALEILDWYLVVLNTIDENRLASFVKVGGRKLRTKYKNNAVETKITETRIKIYTIETRDFDMLENAESSDGNMLASAFSSAASSVGSSAAGGLAYVGSTLASAGHSIKRGVAQGFHDLKNAGSAVHRTFGEPIVGFGSRMVAPFVTMSQQQVNAPLSQPTQASSHTHIFQPTQASSHTPVFQSALASSHTPVFQSAPVFQPTPVFQQQSNSMFASGGAPELQVNQMPQQQQQITKLSDLPQPVASKQKKGGFTIKDVRTDPNYTKPPVNNNNRTPKPPPPDKYPKEKLDSDIYGKEKLDSDDDTNFGGSSKTRKRRHNKRTHRIKPRKLMSRRQKYSRRK